jgi:hypothetical protein
MSKPPAAFLSYVRTEDKHEEGSITELRQRLEGEIRIHTGQKDFTIFQDGQIGWGEQWQARIDSVLDGATFFIPILTPLFFKSEACREEAMKFLRREEELKRRDLILPIYYVDTSLLNDPDRRATDPLAVALATHQYIDWRELRLEPLSDPRIRRMLSVMATQVLAALNRSEQGPGVSQESHRQPSNIPVPSTQAAGAKSVQATPPTATGIRQGSTSEAERPPQMGGDRALIGAAVLGLFIGYIAGWMSKPASCKRLHEIVDSGQLADVRWQYARDNGSLMTPGLQLAQNHRVAGYDNPNERTWQIDNGKLVFYDQNGTQTTQFTEERCALVLVGPTIPGVPFRHTLMPMITR